MTKYFTSYDKFVQEAHAMGFTIKEWPQGTVSRLDPEEPMVFSAIADNGDRVGDFYSSTIEQEGFISESRDEYLKVINGENHEKQS